MIKKYKEFDYFAKLSASKMLKDKQYPTTNYFKLILKHTQAIRAYRIFYKVFQGIPNLCVVGYSLTCPIQNISNVIENSLEKQVQVTCG